MCFHQLPEMQRLQTELGHAGGVELRDWDLLFDAVIARLHSCMLSRSLPAEATSDGLARIRHEIAECTSDLEHLRLPASSS
jgi:hypothetical protein